MRVIVSGANGHMGQIVVSRVEAADDMELAAKVSHSGTDGSVPSVADVTEEADIVIDFSNHEGTKDLLEACVAKNLPAVIATTGQTEEELAQIQEAAEKIPVFYSANMSVGIALLTDLVRRAAAVFQDADVEIQEIHHNRKLDAPSGTAIMLGDAVKEVRPDAVYEMGRSGHHKREKNEIGFSSLRMGNIVGTHEVFFCTDSQTISLKHEAHDRALFADGALDAARFLLGKPAGFYTMKDLIG